MNDYIARFQAAPASFKKSFAYLTAAWICHPLFIYSLFHFEAMVDASGTELNKMVVVSLSLCFFLFLIKKWARALVVVGSVFIVINDFFFFLVTPRNQVSTLLLVAVVLCTLVGTYWLFTKASRDYFTKVNPKPEPPDVNTGPSRPR